MPRKKKEQPPKRYDQMTDAELAATIFGQRALQKIDSDHLLEGPPALPQIPERPPMKGD